MLKSPASGDRHQNLHKVRNYAKYYTIGKGTSPRLLPFLAISTAALVQKRGNNGTAQIADLNSLGPTFIVHTKSWCFLIIYRRGILITFPMSTNLWPQHNKMPTSPSGSHSLGDEMEILLRDLKQMAVFSRGLKQYLVIFPTLDLLTLTPDT